MIKYQRRLNVINFVEDIKSVKIGDRESSDIQLSQFGLIEEKMSRSHKN